MYVLSGLGDAFTDAMASAIAQIEGFNTEGTIAQRQNNPGDLRSGAGMTGTVGGYAVFPDPATGYAALDAQIDLNRSRGLTMTQFFAGGNGYAGYAPAADSNQPVTYANEVAAAVGVDPSQVLPLPGASAAPDTTYDVSADDLTDFSDSLSAGNGEGLFTTAWAAIGITAAAMLYLAFT